MALTLLPEEVLEQIIEHLNIKELLSCSAVSLEWREKFNADVFWKRFCIKQIKDYLEDIECEVQPTFTLPEQHEDRLQPICSWRIHYMRNIHLLNNWKAEKFSSFEFRTYAGVISTDVKIDCDGIHWLFIRTESVFEIWNINTTPHLHASVPMFANCPSVSVVVAGKQAVITQWNILSVFSLHCNEESSGAMFRFVLEENGPLPVEIWGSVDMSDIDYINEEDDFRFTNFGNLVVGYKRVPNPQSDLSMHLWDVSTGEKLTIGSMLNSLSDESEVAFVNIFKIDDIKGLIRLVYLSAEEVLNSQLFVYDFKKLKFTDFDIMFEGVVVWCGCAQNIIVTFSSHPGGTIKFYNYHSKKLLSVKEIGEHTNSEQIQLIGSYFMYCMFNCMNVLDIHKQEIIYCLEFSFYSFVRKLTIIEPRFVVVWLLERGGSPGCPSYYQEVWDMKHLNSKLFHCSSELGFEMVTNSSSIIKQVIAYNGMMCLYTFW